MCTHTLKKSNLRVLLSNSEDVVLQSVIREDGEVAAADVEVVSSGERQGHQFYTQQLLLPAGAHTATES